MSKYTDLTKKELDKLAAEMWSYVDGYPNYAVSSRGRVRNNNTGKTLKPQRCKNKRLTVSLCRFGKKKRFKVHRLVLESFVGLCPEGYECDHIDQNPSNNHVSNLRWVTREQNLANYKPKTGCRHNNAKLNLIDIKNILVMSKHISRRETAKRLGVHVQTVCDVLNGVSYRGEVAWITRK